MITVLFPLQHIDPARSLCTGSRYQEDRMNRRNMTLVVVAAAVVALAAPPALAQEEDTAPRPDRPERLYPPAWVDETVDELRVRVAERVAAATERIEDSSRLADEQRARALEGLADASAAVAAVDEPAEIVGTATSRAQLQRIAWRADRRGDTPDYDEHIARDLDRAALRYEHLITVTGWAEAAGVDVSAISDFLDEASVQLEIARDGDSVEKRHDAVHIATAWMTKAHTTLMAA